jgi:murein peptide amidase A
MPTARFPGSRRCRRLLVNHRARLLFAAALCLCALAGLMALGVATPQAQATATGEISGTVTSVSHVALAGIEVRAHRSDGSGGWEPLEFVESAADGSYNLGGLEAGDYRLEFSDATGSYATQYYDDEPDLASASDVAVRAGATAPGIDAALTGTDMPTATASGAAAPAWLVIGRSVRGRHIVVARFGTGQRHVLVIGGVHGNETGTAVATKFAAYLVLHPAAVPAGAQIDVIRCLNPDGRALRTRGNARRVDLNRNLPTRSWRRRLKREDPSARLGLSGGRGPGSEPETKALLAYLKRGFAVVLSLHSHAGILDAGGPGGTALARRMSRLCGLPVGHLSYQSSITGSLGDYVPATYRIPIITVELKNAKLGRGLRSALLVSAR